MNVATSSQAQLKMHFVLRLCSFWIVSVLIIYSAFTLSSVYSCLDCGGEDPVPVVQNAAENKISETPPDSKTSATDANVEVEKESSDTPSVSGSDTSASDKKDENSPKTEDPPRLKEYKKYFFLQRGKQLEAVRNIALHKNIEQRNMLVNMMLKQLFVTLGDARENLTVAGFLPGDPFPEEDEVRDSMSRVLENTAMFGDLILFLPDVVHSIYDKEKEWQLMLAWSYGFSTQSGVYEGNYETMLTLMAMESNIIPKGKEFVNPFQSLAKLQAMADVLKKTEQKNKTKKPKKKIERGPKLRKTEL